MVAKDWNICVADAAGVNRWVAVTTDGKSNKEPDWAVPAPGRSRENCLASGVAAACGPAGLLPGCGGCRSGGGGPAHDPHEDRRGDGLVPAGRFRMGCGDSEPEEAPLHEVSLDAFYMDRTEVTQGNTPAWCRSTRRISAEQTGRSSR